MISFLDFKFTEHQRQRGGDVALTDVAQSSACVHGFAVVHLGGGYGHGGGYACFHCGRQIGDSGGESGAGYGEGYIFLHGLHSFQ